MTFSVREEPENRVAYMMLDEINHRSVRAIRQGWFAVGKVLKSTANQQILHKPKSGRVYLKRLGKRRIRHRASAGAPAGPFGIGESPANFTGTYRKSFGFKVYGWEEMEFGSMSGRGADKYADFLETGTSKMDPRPGVRNAWLANQGNAVSIFEQTIRQYLENP